MISNRRGGGGGSSTSKTKRSKRAEWDSTLTDLSIHRLSVRDLDARHQMFVSKNLEAARKELYEKPKVYVGKKKPLTETQLQLQEVLNEAEESLASVQGLCDEFPKRYSANPYVTVAPHILSNKENLERALQESTLGGECPTAVMSPGGIRHDTLTDIVPPIPAINEVGRQGTYQSSMDLEHFHSVLERVSPHKDKCEVAVEPDGVEKLLAEELASCMDVLGDESIGTQLQKFDVEGKKLSVPSFLLALLKLLKKSHSAVQEVKENNCNLIETVTEQQTVIDMLAQDILLLKQQNVELQAMIDKKCECLEGKIRETQHVPPFPSFPFIPHPPIVSHALPPGYCIVPPSLPPHTMNNETSYVTSRDNESFKSNKSVSFAPLPIFNPSND